MAKNHTHETIRSEIVKKTLLFLTVGILLGAMATFFEEAYGERKLTKSQTKQCENLYFNFKKYGQEQFITKFTFKLFIKECVKLYNDPKWTFDGKEKIDKFYEKKYAAKNAEPRSNDVQVSMTKKFKIADSRYVIAFDACTKDTKMLSVFLINSDTEKFIATSQKLVPKDSCSTYWTNVSAKLPESIEIEYFKDHQNYPNLSKKVLRV